MCRPVVLHLQCPREGPLEECQVWRRPEGSRSWARGAAVFRGEGCATNIHAAPPGSVLRQLRGHRSLTGQGCEFRAPLEESSGAPTHHGTYLVHLLSAARHGPREWGAQAWRSISWPRAAGPAGHGLPSAAAAAAPARGGAPSRVLAVGQLGPGRPCEQRQEVGACEGAFAGAARGQHEGGEKAALRPEGVFRGKQGSHELWWGGGRGVGGRETLCGQERHRGCTQGRGDWGW